MQKLNVIFENYIKVAQRLLVKQKKEEIAAKGFHLLINKPMELNALVSKLEEREEFLKLLENTKATFEARESLILFLVQSSAFPLLGNPLNPLDPGNYTVAYGNDTWWKLAIHNFFCRSGCYSDIFDGKTVDIERLFLNYCNALQEEQYKIKYFIPLGYVTFSDPFMAFNNFYIKKFDKEELDTILQSKINMVFYTYAFFDTKDIDDYFYICSDYDKTTSKEMYEAYDGKGGADYRFNRYGLYPKKADIILKCLSLFNWEEKSLGYQSDSEKTMTLLSKKSGVPVEDEYHGLREEDYRELYHKFTLPFLIEVYDNPLCFPSRPPKYSEWSIFEHRDFDFDKRETEKFKKFIKNAIRIVERVRGKKEWKFIDNSIEFLHKAFFSEGVEELLWNITAIESLVGQKSELKGGITKILAERISKILARTEDERRKLLRQFGKLYDYRSNIVHGTKYDEDIRGFYYFLARNLARRTVQTFLDCVESDVKIRVSDRKEIISSLQKGMHSNGKA